jgi:hypothetical protein
MLAQDAAAFSGECLYGDFFSRRRARCVPERLGTRHPGLPHGGKLAYEALIEVKPIGRSRV